MTYDFALGVFASVIGSGVFAYLSAIMPLLILQVRENLMQSFSRNGKHTYLEWQLMSENTQLKEKLDHLRTCHKEERKATDVLIEELLKNNRSSSL